MTTTSRLAAAPHELAERALTLSRSDGCVVLVEEETAANLRWAGNALTTDGVSAARRVTVVATSGSGPGARVGVVSHGGAADDVLPDLVAEADRAARAAEPAPDAMPLIGGDPADRADGWDEPAEPTTMVSLGGLASALGAAFAEASGRGHELFGYAEQHTRTTFLATSAGLRRRHDHRAGHVELTGRSTDGSRSAWAGAPSGAAFSDTLVPDLAAQVTRQLGWARRRVELPPGRYETVLPPAAVADLMNYVYWSAGGRAAAQGRSVFSRAGGGTRLGERLTDVPLTLRSDPHEPALRCAPFVVNGSSDEIVSVFDNGLALRPTTWLDRGVLSALVQTRHSAEEFGLPVTPHIDNLVLEADGASAGLTDLVAHVEHGLLLTTLWYIREVDQPSLLLTGLTRDGVYLVEGGEVVGAVHNFRFNDGPLDLLGRVLEAGPTRPTRAREWGGAFSGCAMPPLRVADFHLSSVSRAV